MPSKPLKNPAVPLRLLRLRQHLAIAVATPSVGLPNELTTTSRMSGAMRLRLRSRRSKTNIGFFTLNDFGLNVFDFGLEIGFVFRGRIRALLNLAIDA